MPNYPAESRKTTETVAAASGLQNHSLTCRQINNGVGLVGHEFERRLSRAWTRLVSVIVKYHDPARREARIKEGNAVVSRLFAIDIDVQKTIGLICDTIERARNPSRKGLETMEF